MQNQENKGSEKGSTRQPSTDQLAESQSCKIHTSEQRSSRNALRRLGSVVQAFLAFSLLSALLYCVLYSLKLYP